MGENIGDVPHGTMVDGQNYKEVFKKTGLTPEQWNKLQKENDRRCKVQTNEEVVQVFSCKCRSCWCKKCATGSQTNAMISNYLEKMDWKITRHIILTVSRTFEPRIMFETVLLNKGLWKLTKKLNDGAKYLWVLEFHKGGYPHWHLLIENEAGMFTKRKIESKWRYGLVWESYIKNEKHWKAIKGYHNKKGYLAGENKAHQLELPDYLQRRANVRKFGTNIKREERRAKGRQKAGGAPQRRKRGANRPFQERLHVCDQRAKIHTWSDRAWHTAEEPGSALRGRLDADPHFEKLSHSSWGTTDRKHAIRLLEDVESRAQGLPTVRAREQGDQQKELLKLWHGFDRP